MSKSDFGRHIARHADFRRLSAAEYAEKHGFTRNCPTCGQCHHGYTLAALRDVRTAYGSLLSELGKTPETDPELFAPFGPARDALCYADNDPK